MMYVVKKLIDKLWDEYGFEYESISYIKDEQYPEFWQKHSLEYFHNLDDDGKERFVIFYPKYMANMQYPKVQNWDFVDEYVRVEWEDYLTKIHKLSYWYGDNTNMISISIFKDDTDEKFFNYVVNQMSQKNNLNGAILSYLYHIMSKWFYGKQKEYLSYCKKFNIQFNQIAQRGRYCNLNHTYNSDTSVYRRYAFETAQKRWNESNDKQYEFSKEIKSD